MSDRISGKTVFQLSYHYVAVRAIIKTGEAPLHSIKNRLATRLEQMQCTDALPDFIVPSEQVKDKEDPNRTYHLLIGLDCFCMSDMKKYLAELPGTFVLVFIGTGSATP